MGAGHSAEGDVGANSDPPAHDRKKTHRRRRHSVDSVASYSSQNHVDRIRTQNFSAASCQDECDFGSIKTSLFKRSSSNLEYPIKRPESVTSTSSTRSRLRELVERKSSQDEHKPAANTVADIQYFENPTETLEFDKPRNTLEYKKNSEERPKKRKSKQKDGDTKNKKQEKYQSKLAEYYKLPVQLPQDEFYQHLTRSKAAEEFLQKRFSNSDTEFSGSYGRLCRHKEIEGSNLRRSRSLAVIREETFTDLQIQNHQKIKRSQLIPRARLFDKPCFRDRLTGRAKYQTKEEVLEGIYIDSTVSCFAEINRQNTEEEPTNQQNNIDDKSQHDEVSRNESRNSRSVNGSWPNLNKDSKQINLSEDSIGHSRNPSEIDSLDSNYVRKHYNFEAHLKNYNNSSPDTERSVTSQNNCKDLYIITDDHDSENEVEDRPKSLIGLENEKLQDCIQTNSDHEAVAYDVISIKSEESSKANLKTNLLNENTEELIKDCDIQSVLSENDGTISSPTDSITSYISISIASSDKSHKLEYLANSLAEKIDEYCDSQFQENNAINCKNTQSDKKDLEAEPVYTSIHKKTTFADIKRDSCIHQTNDKSKETPTSNITTDTQSEHYISNTFIGSDVYNKNKYHISSKNITTEPYVATLVENQYYSLPDINISKCLRKSERIDAQLRKEDPEDIPCENTYEVAQTHFREILSSKNNESYGHLNKINITFDNNCTEIKNTTKTYQSEIETSLIQNFSKLEDDLKSIITIDSSNADDSNSNIYELDHHQNEREINEIEGTIRNNKVITKSESLKLASKVIHKPDITISKSFSNDNINKSIKDRKTNNGIKKHYSLRQRNPTDDENFRLPSPTNTVEIKTSKPIKLPARNLSFSEQIKNHSLLSRVQSFKTSAESNIAIVPLSGHQTIVIDPPLSQETLVAKEKVHSKNEEITLDLKTPRKSSIPETQNNITKANKEEKLEEVLPELKNNAKDPFITIKLKKVVKKTIPKLDTVSCDSGTFSQQQLQRPPPRLIIKENKIGLNKLDVMTRPQVLQVIDSKSKRKNIHTDSDKSNFTMSCQKTETASELKDVRHESNNDKEKLNNAIKTDIEYQEKINSVKNYWSKLIDKSPESHNGIEIIEKTDIPGSDNKDKESQEIKHENDSSNSVPEVSVNRIIKSLESVKIVDSIKKITQTKLQLWKEETEKVKSDSEIEETPVEKIIKENVGTIYDNPRLEKQIKKPELEISRDTPDIEIVELSSDDNKNQKTQATLIKAKGFDKGCDEFDHVRYKVMKSELFKNSMIANYRKEAQFDGLLQYLQDYSFQELLVNNNIVIIEPVRTKVEPAPRKNTNTDTCKIPPTFLKKNDHTSHVDKSKNAIRRHFFYHPIRVNKEIIEEELPNPDTVKKVRNLFEDTLKMKSPMTHDPPLVDENTGLTRRATSYRNLSEETKSSKSGGRKKMTRQLTIDTNFGNKKWDNASLSSGVSSGDLSSNNDYETDGLSPYSQKTLKDNVYSSSDEYLCDSASQDFCCESQYVSPDILKKIRECGTSVTYYGGKVMNSKTTSTVSPMTKAIMEEIKSLQKNCSRDCYSCQTKCKGDKCSCLVADKHQQMLSDKQTETFTEFGINQSQDKSKRTEGFPGFKFKLVKSNSCSSRLELTGTDEARHKFRKQNSKEDPPLLHDDENSVKNKICRLESYNKGMVKTPFQQKECGATANFNNIMKEKNLQSKAKSSEMTVSQKSDINLVEKTSDDSKHTTGSDENILEINKQNADNNTFEKKFFYLNNNTEQNKVSTGKFGEMVFEEFEVLETCFDSLNSNRSLK